MSDDVNMSDAQVPQAGRVTLQQAIEEAMREKRGLPAARHSRPKYADAFGRLDLNMFVTGKIQGSPSSVSVTRDAYWPA